MRFYWIKYRIKQDNSHVLWKTGMKNLGYYFTKHHPPHHHREMRPIYLHTESNTEEDSMRVCSLISATPNLLNYNTISIPKYDRNGTPKVQSTQR